MTAGFAPAKVNLWLHVVGRRADGRHDLDSLVVFADFGDDVRFADHAGIDGPFASALRAEISGGAEASWGAAKDAWLKSSGDAKTPAFHVTKNIPLGAGLGGGSADAAAALRLLNQQAANPLDDDALAAMGFHIGADVPVCLASVPARVGGLGERVAPLSSWPTLDAVLVYPSVALSTLDVFHTFATDGGFGEEGPVHADADDPRSAMALLEETRNDLTDVAGRRQPAVGEALSALGEHASSRVVRMTGSGSTCFALFDDAGEAGVAAARIQKERPAWWVRACRLRGTQP